MLITGLITSLVFVAAPQIARDDAGIEMFEKRVRPVLVERCYSCHSTEAKRVRGELYLDSRAGWAKGGSSGPALVPGDPDSSRLILAVRYGHEELEMPPRGKLAEEEIATLVEWVERGAPDPRLQEVPADTRRAIDIEASRRTWAFRAPQAAAVPQPKDAAWAWSDIDRFLLARLEAEELLPAREADRLTKLRRVTFDLTGLPPAPEAIDAYLADESEQAFATVVDQLLSSQAYGERWGRHWLDVARFAESSGGGRSLMFPNAWRYRDYVIESYAQDLPFDRFLTEQLAGDLLPLEGAHERNRAITATGFLVLGPTNYEQQDKELLLWDVIDEQIDTVGRAFLGLTLGCARCHDHKFDPVPTADYYSLAGIFSSTDLLTAGNVSGYVETELAGPATDTWNAFQKREAALLKKVRKAQRDLKGSAAGPVASSIDPKQLAGLVLDDTRATLIGDWKHSAYVKGYVGMGYLHDENKAKGDKSITFAPNIPAAGICELRLSYTPGTNRASNTPVLIQTADGEHLVLVNQKLPPPIQGSFVALGRYRFSKGLGDVITVSTKATDGHVIVDAVQLIPVAELKHSAAVPANEAEAGALQKALADVESELKALRGEKPPKPPRAMSVRDARAPANVHIHIRGGVRTLGPEVPRGFLQVCTPDSTGVPANASGRLQLAQWLTDPEHPLTARVYVNRVWHHLFGVGLVRTTDNFGLMGEPPSHPVLLDWLARRFIADGWSTKKLIRLLVLSRAYVSSVQPPPETDPENRLLSSGRRRRLEAEAIRDAILAVSGELDRTAGGLTIHKLAQYDIDYQFDSQRRSVYVPLFRNSMLEFFDVFDIANPNLVTGRRNVSNVAPQALFLLNSPWVREQSQHAALRLLSSTASERQPRLERAFRLTLGRSPTDAESALVTEYLEAAGDPAVDAWADVFHSLFTSLDFRYID